jgi:hypothetical protein
VISIARLLRHLQSRNVIEAVVGVAAVLSGVAAVWFFWDKLRAVQWRRPQAETAESSSPGAGACAVAKPVVGHGMTTPLGERAVTRYLERADSRHTLRVRALGHNEPIEQTPFGRRLSPASDFQND